MDNEITISDVQIIDLHRENDLDQFANDIPIRSCFSENDFCWTYQKNFLKVKSLEKKSEPKLLCKFNFAQILKDKSICITNVKELKEEIFLGNGFNYCKYKLLVSLDRESSGSLFLIVDIKNQSICKCVECPFKIVEIEPISINYSKLDESLPFSPELQIMCGIVALATQNGSVMLLDLCLDTLNNESFDLDYCPPSTVTFIVKKEGIPNNYDLDAKRKSANVHNQHICIAVNDDCNFKGDFIYKLHDGNYRTFPIEEIYITALKYCYQTNTLYIGYNFGGFQSFSLNTFNIYLACSLEKEENGEEILLLPVVGFSLQEPENDPKNFCYLWVLRGELLGEYKSNGNVDQQESPFLTCSTISLFVLEFENKTWINNFGYYYSESVSEQIKFDYFLSTTPYDDEQLLGNSFVVSYGVINQGSVLAYKRSKEDTTLYESNLFHVVWQAIDEQSQNCVNYMLIFDLNQWYQAQMPNVLQLAHNSQFCSFLSFYKLNDVSDLCGLEDIHDVKFDTDSFSRFQQSNYSYKHFENDIYYFPSSLSFNVSFLSETKIIEATYLGIQEKTLSLLNEENENIWLDPDEFLNKCHYTGVFSTEEMNYINNSNKKKLKTILSLALENNEMPFLIQTITNWSNQNNELEKHDCSCKVFLDWLWKEVETLKKLIDENVVPLFDYSETYDSKNFLTLFYSIESKLKSLSVLLNRLKSEGTPTTEQGVRELDLRLNIIQVLIDYVQIIIWCCTCNLLPETEEGNQFSMNNVGFVYPKTQLQTDYNQSRKELVSLNTSLIKHSDLLAIDGIILNTKPVYDLWCSNDNTKKNGLYPPTNIYSLVSIYLEDSVPIEVKHQIMFYFLCDIISYLSDRQDMNHVEKLETFSSSFNLNSSLIQSVQGMWALDHKLFDYSLTQFCDSRTKLTFPNIIDDFKKLDDDLQRRILTSYLYQNKKAHSLQFIKNSHLFNCDTMIKQKLYISVMLSNKLVSEAYNFQRVCRNKENVEELLFHFFLGCEQMKLFEHVFQFELDCLERDTLIYYLLEISESVNSGNLLIIYLLLNKKFVDAYKFLSIIEEKIKKRNLDEDDSYYEKFLNIKSLVNSYIQVLPSSVVKLNLNVDNYAEKQLKKKLIDNQAKTIQQINISRQPKTNDDCSTAVKDILIKIEQISDNYNSNNQYRPPSTPFRKRIEQRGLLLSENSPFIKDQTPEKKNLDLKVALVSNYSLTFNEGSSFNDLAKTKSSEKINSNLLGILRTPKIDKQQKNFLVNNYNPSVSGPSSILKAKKLKNTTNPFNKSGKKKSNAINKLSFLDKDNIDQEEKKEFTDQPLEIDLGKKLNLDLEEQNDMSIDSNMLSLANLEDNTLNVTPINPSFVFSPPLTRSRKKKTNNTDEDDEHSMITANITINDFDLKESDDKKNSKKTPKKLNKSIKADTPTHKMSLRATRSSKK